MGGPLFLETPIYSNHLYPSMHFQVRTGHVSFREVWYVFFIITVRTLQQQQQNYPYLPGNESISPSVWHFWVDDFPNFPRWDMLVPWSPPGVSVSQVTAGSPLHGPMCNGTSWAHCWRSEWIHGKFPKIERWSLGSKPRKYTKIMWLTVHFYKFTSWGCQDVPGPQRFPTWDFCPGPSGVDGDHVTRSGQLTDFRCLLRWEKSPDFRDIHHLVRILSPYSQPTHVNI